MQFRQDKKQFLLQLKRRISDADNGTPIWESEWEDITKYFIQRISEVSFNIDDQTLEGKIEQNSVMLSVNNVIGKFNPEGTIDSFWNGTDEFMYHSRIRLFEWNTNTFQYTGIEDPDLLPIIDGLIAKEPVYKENFTCEIRINSKLDILREHYILEDIIGRSKTVGAQSIVRFAEDLLNTTYAELGITTTGGFFRNDVIYTNITPYDRNLLALLFQTIKDGGGIGGLDRESTLFFSYYGSTPVVKTNFESDGDTQGLWLMDDTDYNGGAGTTIYDQSGNGRDLDTSNAFDDNWKTNGFFDNNVRVWKRECTSFSGLTEYTIELLIRIDINRLTIKDVTFTGGVEDNIYHPLFVFTEEDDPTEYVILEENAVPPIEHECEGLFIDEKCHLRWVRAGDNSAPIYGWRVYEIENKDLGPLFGEGFFQYVAVTVDVTNNMIRFYLNGQQQSKVYMPTLGGLSIEKIVGTGFGQTDKYGATYMENLGHLYFSSMKISDVLKTDSQIFTQYQKIFGSTYTLG